MFRLTGVLLVLFTVYLLLAQAKVVPGFIARDENQSSSKRSMFNIIWGCVSTTIVCAWAAIHPNIAPREGPLKRTLRRLELMFWAIVAPEILPCWALNQLLAAITVRDVYNEGKGYETRKRGIWETVKGWVSLYEIKEAASPAWTVVHGHFLVMGGFHVVEPPIGSTEVSTQRAKPPARSSLLVNTETGKRHGPTEKNLEGRVTILTLEMLRNLVKEKEFEIQTTEEEITDKSKGDALSKLIFILQSTWFILQCVARRAQGLNLTHLELTTLALASLNGITFALWWDKPLGAQVIVRVYLKRKLTDFERVPQKSRSTRSDVIINVSGIFESCLTAIRDASFRCQSENLPRLPVAILVLLLSPIITFTSAFYATLIDLILAKSSSFPPDETHIPTFYVPKHRYSRLYHILLLLGLGVLFGGIHCSGWNFSFPTHVEQKLWHVASLAVTIIPIATFPFVVIITCMDGCLPPIFVFGFAQSTFILCTLAYVFARIVLLVLALALLRHLPSTAFTAISWTKFFPHFL